MLKGKKSSTNLIGKENMDFIAHAHTVSRSFTLKEGKGYDFLK